MECDSYTLGDYCAYSGKEKKKNSETKLIAQKCIKDLQKIDVQTIK